MNKTLVKALLASAGAALVTQAANAATTVYTAGDLLLGFQAVSQTTHGPVTGPNDLVIDIGQASQYYNATTPVTVSGLSLNDINATFTGGFNNLSWAVVGANGNGNGVSPLAMWVSAASPSSAYGVLNTFEQNPDRSAIISVGTGYNGQSSTVNSSTAVEQATSAGNSYAVHMGVNGDLSGGFPANVQQVTGAGFASGGTSFLDLYQMIPTSGTAGSVRLIGTFELATDGTAGGTSLQFSPVPEPATGSLFAGAGLLVLLLRQWSTRKQA